MTPSVNYSLIQDSTHSHPTEDRGCVFRFYQKVDLNLKTLTIQKVAALVVTGALITSIGIGLAVFSGGIFPLFLLGNILYCSGQLLIGASLGIALFGTIRKIIKETKRLSISTKDEITNPQFLELLFAINPKGAKGSAAFLNITSDFLEKSKYKIIYPNAIKELRQAAKREQDLFIEKNFFIAYDSDGEEVYENLMKDPSIPQLITFDTPVKLSTKRHMIGMQFIKDPKNSDSFLYSIFNTGYGANLYHDKELTSRGYKYDLQATWRIPSENFTPDLIKILFDPATMLEDRYEQIEEITGGKRLKIADKIKDGYEVRLQQFQKSGNCTIEWIFAYLKYQMSPEDYYEFRKELFEEILREGLKNPKTRKIIEDNWTVIQKKVARKRAKAAIAKDIKFPIPQQFAEIAEQSNPSLLWHRFYAPTQIELTARTKRAKRDHMPNLDEFLPQELPSAPDSFFDRLSHFFRRKSLDLPLEAS